MGFMERLPLMKAMMRISAWQIGHP